MCGIVMYCLRISVLIMLVCDLLVYSVMIEFCNKLSVYLKIFL